MPDLATKPPDLDAQGRPMRPPDLDPSGRPMMNRALVNGVPVDVPEDGPLDAVKGFVQNVNPIPAIRSMGEMAGHGLLAAGASAIGRQDLAQSEGAKADQPLKDLLHAQNAVKASADEAWAKGDHTTAIRKYLDWLLPIIGPAIDASADKMANGQPWRAVGEATGIGASVAMPEAARLAKVSVPPVARNVNPAEVAAVEFGQARGVPIDAATATGNLFVKGAQKSADATPLGAVVAARFKQSQTNALSRVGSEIAADVYPQSVAPEQAGSGLRGAVQQTIGELHKSANEAYGRLRDMEADPANAGDVPRPPTAQEAGFQRALNDRAKASVGRAPTPEEWAELKRMRDELESVPYERGGTVENANRSAGTENDWTGGDMRQSSYVKRSGNAPVYHDILQYAPGTSKITGRGMVTSIEQALKSGTFSNAAKGALEVARKRIAGHTDVSSALLEKPGTLPPGPTVSMLMPVDVITAKKMLKPVYDRMMRQLPITQQRSSPGLKAMENILNGPDHAPLTQVDTDLGIIKGIARGADLPELRDLSQGLAAQAVKVLDSAVRETAERAGPDALAALEQGRSATRAKYAANDVLRKLSTEPVQAFKSTVWANDAGIQQLRDLADLAPLEMPKIARAYVDDLLSQATAEGGFDKTGRLLASWQKLGPETRRVLFMPDQIQALDKYFLLAKKIGENPNPSGTATTAAAAASGVGLLTQPHIAIPAVLASGGIAKILRSPKAIQMFTNGATLVLGPGKTIAAARAAGWSRILEAAREAGSVGRTMAPAAGTADPTASQVQ